MLSPQRCGDNSVLRSPQGAMRWGSAGLGNQICAAPKTAFHILELQRPNFTPAVLGI